MENSIILDQDQILPPKKRQQTLEQIYSTLVKYPVTKDVIRYPKVTDKTIQPIFHDLISVNIMCLVPNIDIGYQMNMESEQLIDWIKTAKNYVYQLTAEFQKKCNVKLQKVVYTEKYKERSRVFNIDKMNMLPEDIIRHIYGYLMPETRIKLLRARYPALDSNIMKLKVPILKTILEVIRTRDYLPVMNNLYKYNIHRCLPQGIYIKFGFTNKENCMKTINKLIGTYESAVAHTPQDYHYFQKKALKILSKLVYFAKIKKVLDEPYAPELEVPKPIKKPRKSRAKKTGDL